MEYLPVLQSGNKQDISELSHERERRVGCERFICVIFFVTIIPLRCRRLSPLVSPPTLELHCSPNRLDNIGKFRVI
jgi:hypothetical protein